MASTGWTHSSSICCPRIGVRRETANYQAVANHARSSWLPLELSPCQRFDTSVSAGRRCPDLCFRLPLDGRRFGLSLLDRLLRTPFPGAFSTDINPPAPAGRDPLLFAVHVTNVYKLLT